MAISFGTLGATGIQYSSAQVVGVETIHVFGRSTSVGMTFVPVAMGGIFNMPQPAGATTLRIKAGGDAADSAAGAGAQTILLQGLDELGQQVSENIATNGVLASAVTDTTFMRLNQAIVSSSGAYATLATGSHAADIVIEDGAGTEDWATISSASFPRGETEIGLYSVPAGKSAYVTSGRTYTDSNATTSLLVFGRGNILEAAPPFSSMRRLLELTTSGESSTFLPFAPAKVPGPADIGLLAKIETGTSEVGVFFEIIQIDD